MLATSEAEPATDVMARELADLQAKVDQGDTEAEQHLSNLRQIDRAEVSPDLESLLAHVRAFLESDPGVEQIDELRELERELRPFRDGDNHDDRLLASYANHILLRGTAAMVLEFRRQQRSQKSQAQTEDWRRAA